MSQPQHQQWELPVPMTQTAIDQKREEMDDQRKKRDHIQHELNHAQNALVDLMDDLHRAICAWYLQEYGIRTDVRMRVVSCPSLIEWLIKKPYNPLHPSEAALWKNSEFSIVDLYLDGNLKLQDNFEQHITLDVPVSVVVDMKKAYDQKWSKDRHV